MNSMRRALPTIALALLSIGIGAALTVGSLSSMAALKALAAAGLILTGLAEVAHAGAARSSRLPLAAGVSGVAAGVAIAIWPGGTIRVVATVIGIWLVLDAAVEVFARVKDRPEFGIVRLAGAPLGVLVLAWPHVTVFVVAAVLGVYVMLVDVAAMVAGRGPRLRTVPAVVAVVVALPMLALGVWLHASQPGPDAFYTPPRTVPALPGALLRVEPFNHGVPAGAHAWRILYTTTRADRFPAVASALVVAATRIPSGPRPVLAWAHGATGIARQCAPSLLPDPFGGIPGLNRALQDGWVVVATDFIGLGTPGPHPFLIGQGEARSILDAVRAARHLTTVTLGDRTLVWGHSQGGNAALWTGIIAATYAPDAGVIGIAALAPGSVLAPLGKLWGEGDGVINAAYLIQAYSETYPDVRFDTYVRPSAEIQVHELANRCLFAPKVYLSGLSSLLFGRSIWATDPTSGAAGRRLRENTPIGPISMPVLIAQGETDKVVPATIQADYIHQRCAAGGHVDYRTYPGRDHASIIAPDSPVITDLLQWSSDRLDGKPARSTCPS